MSGEQALLELAARIEAATGPDQQLDLDIEVAVGGYTLGKAPPDYDNANESEIYIPAGGVPKGFTYPPKGAIGRHYHVARRSFTGSVDAAITLVPDDLAIEQTSRFFGLMAEVRLFDGMDCAGEAKAATPALALCAAALKARHTQAGDGE